MFFPEGQVDLWSAVEWGRNRAFNSALVIPLIHRNGGPLRLECPFPLFCFLSPQFLSFFLKLSSLTSPLCGVSQQEEKFLSPPFPSWILPRQSKPHNPNLRAPSPLLSQNCSRSEWRCGLGRSWGFDPSSAFTGYASLDKLPLNFFVLQFPHLPNGNDNNNSTTESCPEH